LKIFCKRTFVVIQQKQLDNYVELTIASRLLYIQILFFKVFPLVYAANATIDIDYAKQGACNSTILARVGM